MVIPAIVVPLFPRFPKSCLLWKLWHILLPLNTQSILFYTMILVVGLLLQIPTLRLFSSILSASPTNNVYLCFNVCLDHQAIIVNRDLATVMQGGDPGKEREVP